MNYMTKVKTLDVTVKLTVAKSNLPLNSEEQEEFNTTLNNWLDSKGINVTISYSPEYESWAVFRDDLHNVCCITEHNTVTIIAKKYKYTYKVIFD